MSSPILGPAARFLRSRKVMFTAACLLASSAQAQLVSGFNAEPGEFDQSYGFRDFTFVDADSYHGWKVADVSLSVSFAKTPDDLFSPAFLQEITLSLITLDAVTFEYKEVFLIDPFTLGLGADGEAFNGTIHFSDRALSAIGDDPETLATGSYRPAQALAALNGTAFHPLLWGLFIEDIQTGAPLSYYSAELLVSFQAVPEPSTYALGGAALLVGAVMARRFRARSGQRELV